MNNNILTIPQCCKYLLFEEAFYILAGKYSIIVIIGVILFYFIISLLFPEEDHNSVWIMISKLVLFQH